MCRSVLFLFLFLSKITLTYRREKYHSYSRCLTLALIPHGHCVMAVFRFRKWIYSKYKLKTNLYQWQDVFYRFLLSNGVLEAKLIPNRTATLGQYHIGTKIQCNAKRTISCTQFSFHVYDNNFPCSRTSIFFYWHTRIHSHAHIEGGRENERRTHARTNTLSMFLVF